MAKFICFMLMGTALSFKGRPLYVNLSLMIHELKIFENKYLGVELGGLLTQRWVDSRLGANPKTHKMAINGQIWSPKIVNVVGERGKSDEDTIFWRGFEGRVILSEKINLKIFCTWDYRKFPFDTQKCDFKFGSFRFLKDEVELIWDLKRVKVATNLVFNDFEVTKIETSLEIETRNEGNFSVAVAQFSVKRRSEPYIFCIFLPLNLLNFLSFCVNKNLVFFNVTILIFVLISYSATHPTPYLKTSDIFISICACFSLILLVETLITSLNDFQYSTNQMWVRKWFYPIFYIFVMSLYVFL